MPETTNPTANPTAAVTAVLADLTAAWDAGDAAAYAGLFTPDATYVVFDGIVLHGRAEIERTHRWLFDGPLRASRLSAPDTSASDASGPAAASPERTVRFPRPGVAHVVDASGGVRLAGQEEIPVERASVVSFLLLDDAGTWRVDAFQNTRRQ